MDRRVPPPLLLLLRFFSALLQLLESCDELLRLFDGAGLADQFRFRPVDLHLDLVEREHGHLELKFSTGSSCGHHEWM